MSNIWSRLVNLGGLITGTLPIANGGTANTTASAAFNALSPMTAANDMIVGGTSGAGTAVPTGTIGDISASTLTQAYTVTSATPGVFTISAHGFVTGQTGYVTVTQNGFTAGTTYYIHKIDANTFHLSSSFTNLVTAAYLTSSGTTAGSFVTGGLVIKGASAAVTNANATGVSSLGLQTYYYSTSNSDRTFTTPAVATSNGTRIRLVKLDSGTGKVTVSTTDGSLIGPSNASTLFAQGAATSLDCDGSNWYVTTAAVNSGTKASTFTFNGTGSPGTTASVTMAYTRIGDWVNLFIPIMSAATGTANTNQLIANTAIDAWARPASGNNYPLINIIKDNNLQQTAPGVVQIPTSGIVDILRDGAGTNFTGAGVTSGLATNGHVTYYVGTGS